jgi:hypothetical protein
MKKTNESEVEEEKEVEEEERKGCLNDCLKNRFHFDEAP